MEPISFVFLLLTLLQVGASEPQVITVPMSSLSECRIAANDLSDVLRNNAATADVASLCVVTTLSPLGNPKI